MNRTPLPRTFFGTRKLPARYGRIVMPLMLSILMTCIISLISTLRGIGLAPHFLHIWMQSWGISWAIGFPTLLVVLPLVRKATAALVEVD